MKKIIILAPLFLITTNIIASEDVELERALAESKRTPTPEQKEKTELAQALQESLGVTEEQAYAHALAESAYEHRGKTEFTTTGEPVFQFSYKTDTSNLEAPLIQNKALKFFGYIPLFGHYGTPYVMLNPLAFIENNISSLPNLAPESLLKELGSLLSAPDAENKINFYTTVWGMPTDEDLKNRQYNLIYHTAAVPWLRGSAGFNESEFGIKLPIGIFEPNGIMPAAEASAAFNSVNPEDVSIHPVEGDPAFSPNNVRFVIDPNRSIVTFWSVAFNPDKSKAAVAFNLIILNPDIQYALLQQKKSIKEPRRFWTKLNELVNSLIENKDDRAAFEAAYGKLTKI